jgi:hypothetical protein
MFAHWKLLTAFLLLPLLRQNRGEQGGGKLLPVSGRAETFSSGDLPALSEPAAASARAACAGGA